MKTCIVTLNGHFNYGNRLQNYALDNVLKALECDNQTIWYEDFILQNDPQIGFDFKNVIKYLINWKKFRSLCNMNLMYNTYNIVRQYKIKGFSDKFLDIRYDMTFNEEIVTSNDYFIVGSDQVWNPHFINTKDIYNQAVFLRFANNRQRIAYSASFGISELPAQYKESFKKGLNGIPNISVREEAGAKIVKELTGRDVPVLVDPTLLLTKEEWQNVSMEPDWYKGGKYILTYFLGDVPNVLKKLAEKYGYKIYNLMDRDDLNLYTSRVEEFLWLVNHAQLVCTDSFHACVFSIIFNTPFLVVNRKQAGVADMTSRLDTLMKLFGYEDRFIDFNSSDIDFNKVMTMDFSGVVDIQNRERERSLKFLKDAMNLE